jgi:hypothetical protein
MIQTCRESAMHVTPRSTRHAPYAAVGALLLLAGCGGVGVTPVEPSRTASAAASATSRTTASPEPSEVAGPSPVVPTDVPDEGDLELVWEESGDPPSSRPGTSSPAVDAEGRIWVAVSFDDTFWVFDRDGQFLESWGTSGTGDGEFDFARNEDEAFGAIAFAPDGSFYVADTGNHRVQHFDAERAFLEAWGDFGTGDGQFASPSVITVAADGSVYVLDDQRGVIQRFGADGTFDRSIAPGRVWPLSLRTDAESNLFYVEGMPATLHKLAPDGAVLLRVQLDDLLDFPTGIAVRDDGRMLVAGITGSGAFEEPDRLIELAPDGTLLHAWSTGADGIVLDPSGDRLYTAFYRWDHLRAYAIPEE